MSWIKIRGVTVREKRWVVRMGYLCVRKKLGLGDLFLVLINICSFVFSPCKNKSHFFVPTKLSISVFSPIKLKFV